MSRLVPGRDWIKGFQYWMQESEAPDSYIIWAAIAALAGSTKRQVSCRWVYHRYYTNHYIILVGPAGIVHKSATIDMVRTMLREIEVPIASEGMTKEAFIKQLITRSDGTTCALTALPDEFSDFIRPSGPPMLEFLTSIYGCPEAWEYTTRAHDTEIITKAFLNLFGGTTPRWIANEFDITFTEQGFASRTLFVHELEPRFRKAKVRITDDMYRMYKLLVEDLHHIASLKGEFQWQHENVEDWFAEWYESKLPREIETIDYKLKSYLARKPTHMLKLAMVLQLAKSDELYITMENMKTAKTMLDELEVSMARTFSAVGRNIYANDLERIYQDIKIAGGMGHREVARRNYGAMNKQILDEVMATLSSMGMLKKEFLDGEWFYTAIGS